jgi:large subunit ribosomal protein L4
MADTTFSADAYSASGAKREAVTLPSETFDGTVNVPAMHQAVKVFLNNQRQGNASTKTRGIVTGGNQKPWRQKGTGRARQGSIRAPNWPGGGTVFGPSPRSYAESLPRKMRALAKKSALNARAREGAVVVVDALAYDAPKTANVRTLLRALGADDKKVLILTDGVNENAFLSSRNIQNSHVMPYADASTYHILWSDVVVIESGALGVAVQGRGDAPAKPARGRKTASKGK